MGRLLLITGDIAAGKSTFAQILSRRYEVNYFTKDAVKEVLGDTVGFSDRAENLKLSAAAVGLLQFLFSEFSKLDKPLILEANFHRAELQRLHETAAAAGYEVLTLALRGDVRTLHKRYLNRMNNQNRHPVHLSTNVDVFENFEKAVKQARSEEIDGNVIYVDAGDFTYQTDGELLAKLDSFMREEP